MSNKTYWGLLLAALCFGMAAHAQNKDVFQLKGLQQFHFAGCIAKDSFFPGPAEAGFLSVTPQFAGMEFCGDSPYTTDQQLKEHRPEEKTFRRSNVACFIPVPEEDGLTADMRQSAFKEAVAVGIAEGLLLDTSSFVDENLLAMRDSESHLALCDFGAGYSAMAYLQVNDNFNNKKDTIVVRKVEHNLANKSLCGADVMMAHDLNIQVIAEGVETTGQAAVLVVPGCHYGKGYFIPKLPLPESFEHVFGTGISVTWAASRHTGSTQPRSNPSPRREVGLKT